MKATFLPAASVLAAALLPVTPALAAPPPLVAPATDGMTPQQVCDAQLVPGDSANFQTWPKNISGPTLVSQGAPVKAATPFQTDPGGTPTYSGFSNWGAPFRNGGSPNIWASATYNNAVYPFSVLHFHTTVTSSYTTSFGCEVQKRTESSHPVDPKGLESEGNMINSTITENGPDITEQGGPITVPGTFVAQILICNSPNNTTKAKPGDWVGKHGFTSQGCYDLDKSNLSTFVPSMNAPDVFPGS